MKEAFAQYLSAQKGYSPHTCIAYLGDLERLAEWLQSGHQTALFELSGARTVTNRQLRAWMAAELQAGKSPRSVARALAAVKTYFRFLCDHARLDANPALRVRSPRLGRRLPEFLSEPQAALLLDQTPFPDGWTGIRDRCLLEVLYGCGLRRSELAGLQLRHIDLYNRTLRVFGKGGKTRILPFGTHVAAALSRWLQVRRAEGFAQTPDASVFVRKQGAALSPESIYALVRKYLLSSSSVQRGPHLLRHTFATHLLNQGADLNDIKELLGHKSLAATQVYTHNSITQLSKVHALAHPRASKPKGGNP